MIDVTFLSKNKYKLIRDVSHGWENKFWNRQCSCGSIYILCVDSTAENDANELYYCHKEKSEPGKIFCTYM